jgi:putative flavoprotein involved in K+ transport
MHSSDYRGPSQLRDGGVLIVGAANSGAEIAIETVRHHKTWISGKHPIHVPFRIDGFFAKLFLMRFIQRFLFHRVFRVTNFIGRKVREKLMHKAAPLLRTKPVHLIAAGVEHVGRTAGVRNGLPVLEDGRLVDVKNVIWCTGYHPGFSWIDLPIFGDDGDPLHDQGVVKNHTGLYFVGLFFLHSMSSVMVHGVGRDAERIVEHIASTILPPAPSRLTAIDNAGIADDASQLA